MKFFRLNFLKIAPLSILASCATTNIPTVPDRQTQSVDKISRLLEAVKENKDSFEYEFTYESDCISALKIKWPKWRLDDLHYSSAITVINIDWKEIGSASYENVKEYRPPKYDETFHSYISVDFLILNVTKPSH